MIRAILTIVFLCASQNTFSAVYRLVELNGDVVTERAVVSVTIPRDGVIVIVPDRIFHDTESAAQPPKRSTGPPQPKPKRGSTVIAEPHKTARYWDAYGV